MANYLKRIADDILQKHLSSSGAILIEGAKWCGKTWTAREASSSVLYMQDPDKQSSYLKTADTKPSILLQGETPRLLDEWQVAPVLWDAVRFAVDQRGETSQFILTGSAVPTDNLISHTGTGRIARMTMRPMSLYESLESTGTVSLKSLLDGNLDVNGFSKKSIEDLAESIVRGGWPASVGKDIESSIMRAVDYVEAVINMDVSRVDGITKNPMRTRALLRSLARNISTMATNETIRKDIALNNESENTSDKTLSQYLRALNRIFLLEDVPAWSPSIRSKTAIRTSAKRQFVDPSIATAVLRMTPQKLLDDFNYFGFLFESLCIRDLRIYAEANDGQVFHYRDKSGLEVDAIIALNDGRWGAVEIKLGNTEIEEGAKHLLALNNKVHESKMKKASFLMILTGTDIAYKRQDGVYIVPIACLKD